MDKNGGIYVGRGDISLIFLSWGTRIWPVLTTGLLQRDPFAMAGDGLPRMRKLKGDEIHKWLLSTALCVS